MAVLPGFVHELFWDVDPKAVDPDRHYFFVLERLLEEGDDAAIRWVMSLTETSEQPWSVLCCSSSSTE